MKIIAVSLILASMEKNDFSLEWYLNVPEKTESSSLSKNLCSFFALFDQIRGLE